MPPSGDLLVRVRASEGGPALGRWVSIEAWTGDAASGAPSDRAQTPPESRARIRWSETDVDGRVTFRGIAAGEILVRVHASRAGFSGLEGTLAEERVTIEAGAEKSVELELR